MLLGAHIGTSDGLASAARTAREIGADAMQIFSKSPHSWKGAPIPPENAAAYREERARRSIRASAVHHCYLTNLASPKPTVQAQSRAAFLDDLGRADLLGADHLIFHPGAHLGTGPAAGIGRIAEALNWALAEAPDAAPKVLLENAAGQGTTIGGTFEELALLLDRIGEKARVGVAIDTCHLFASGVDFRSTEGYGRARDALRATVGARTVRAFHLNDSKADCGAHLDRHENIGRGRIGLEGFRHLVNDPLWAKVPGYLETPLAASGDYSAYVADLGTLRGLLGAPA